MSALSGIRVVDMSRYLSGPTLTMLLADMGADVIKVEDWPRGDPARETGPFVGTESVYYMASNRNKRSIAVKFRSPEGRNICRQLAETADIFVQNFRPGVATRMGLGWAELRERNPRLIYCSISGFGAEGPGATLAGFDQTAQAMSGLMSVTGTEETGPLRVGIPVADSSTGVLAAFEVVTALVERGRTGRGQLVECSLMGTMLFLMSYQAQKYLSLGEVPGQDGNDHPLMFPQGVFKTLDGGMSIASGNEQMWERLARVLELDELLSDPRFLTNADRMQNRRQLRRLIEGRLSARPTAEWVGIVASAGVPCGPVLDVGEALEHPIARALDMVQTVAHTTLGTMRVLGRPVRGGADVDDWLRLAPPTLGEHTREICSEIGITGDAFQRLINTEVIGAARLGSKGV